MRNTANNERRRRVSTPYPVSMLMFSLAAIVATYLLANSSLEVAAKTRAFSGIVAAFLTGCVCLYLWQTRRGSEGSADEGVWEMDVANRLLVLDEANQFFGGSLRSADTFRLVSSRVRELIPFQAIVLYLLDETRSQLRVSEAEGPGSEGQKGSTISLDEGLAGKCFSSREVETDKHPSAAIPLCRGTEVFGVLMLDFDTGFDLPNFDFSLFGAVGTRVAPLVLSAVAFEQSQVNALTDATTDLPNERAFYLILENQIAETQRNSDDRPLTILAVDIKNFDEINQKFGHAAGDRVLNFVAQVVKDNLRQMDFFARSMNDEFLAILPTASKEVSHEVVARVDAGFFERKVRVNASESVEIELNFGWAAFGEDGETSDQLLRAARMRKEQAKSTDPNRVLWFSKDLVDRAPRL